MFLRQRVTIFRSVATFVRNITQLLTDNFSRTQSSLNTLNHGRQISWPLVAKIIDSGLSNVIRSVMQTKLDPTSSASAHLNGNRGFYSNSNG
jgi:hypothetical protein